MTEVEAGGTGHRVRREKIEQYMVLADSDARIVAFSMHPDKTMATFYTYLQGKTSQKSDSWQVYIRKDLNHSSWKVGSSVEIGDPDIYAPSPTG